MNKKSVAGAHVSPLADVLEAPRVAYFGEELKYGNELVGPAVIEEETTTIVLPPEKRLKVKKYGNYLIVR